MLLAAFTISILDACAKALTTELPTSQVVFLRTLFALPAALLICHFEGGIGSLRTHRWGWQLYRSLLSAFTIFSFFWALVHIPLATALILINLAPVFVALLSPLLLQESVNLRQWIGIGLAFCGVLFIFDPSATEEYLPILILIVAAVSYALISISNRRLGGLETPGALAFYTLPASLTLGGALAVGEWVEPTTFAWGLAIVAGAAGGLAHYFFAVAFKYVEAARVAPLEYTSILWAALAGYVFWNEMPGTAIWLGGLAIVIGGYLSSSRVATRE